MKTVLIVDDAKTMRSLAQFALNKAGYTILEANDGVEALKVMSDTSVDLIISDVNMPNMNGLELVGNIKANAAWKDIPIFMLTTESSEEVALKGKMKIIGNGNNHIPFVHVSDVALAISNSLGNATGTFVLVGEQKTQEEIFSIAAKELSVPEPKSSIPQSLALLTLQFRKLLSSKQSEFTAEHILVLSCERQFNYAKSRKDLSFSPRSIEEGIKEMVTCYKKLRL